MEQGFKGKTALVTGAGSGIGKGLVHRLVELGATVIGVGQKQSKLDTLKSELGDKVTTISVNLGDWDETELKLGDLCKNVDYLVNNAGYSYNCVVDQVINEEFDKVMAINLKAPMNLIRLVAPGMKQRRFGSIVNVSSASSLIGVGEHIIYSASKAGLDSVTKVGAKELGPYNIRVNSINPTVVWTDMAKSHWDEPVRKSELLKQIPSGRFVEIHEVVEPIVFLLSNGSTILNGILLPVDGGLTAT